MEPKLRVLFDSSVYGWLVEQDYLEKFAKLAAKREDVTFYGNRIIRNELKNTPKNLKHGRRKVRMLLLTFYDSVVGRHEIEVAEIVEDLAKYYLLEYKGGVSREKIKNDFLIVASATIAGLDIVVSEDNKTMLSPQARRAYEKINLRNSLLTPNFYGFGRFESLLEK